MSIPFLVYNLRFSTVICEIECFFRPRDWLSFFLIRCFMLRLADILASCFSVSLLAARLTSLCFCMAASRISACVRLTLVCWPVLTVAISTLGCLLFPVESENIGFCSRNNVSLSARARDIADGCYQCAFLTSSQYGNGLPCFCRIEICSSAFCRIDICLLEPLVLVSLDDPPFFLFFLSSAHHVGHALRKQLLKYGRIPKLPKSSKTTTVM